MSKLFRVYDIETGKYQPERFGNKVAAKQLRRQLNSAAQRRRYVIKRGEDPWRGAS